MAPNSNGGVRRFHQYKFAARGTLACARYLMRKKCAHTTIVPSACATPKNSIFRRSYSVIVIPIVDADRCAYDSYTRVSLSVRTSRSFEWIVSRR